MSATPQDATKFRQVLVKLYLDRDEIPADLRPYLSGLLVRYEEWKDEKAMVTDEFVRRNENILRKLRK